MNSSFDEARSPFRSSSTPLSPANKSLEINNLPRIVQKQVLHLRAGPRACSVVLYLRLALPASSKTTSYPLFSDEGVKLKSSVIYPVQLTKGNRTLIPPDASQGLRAASRILALDSVGRSQNGAEVSEASRMVSKAKEARPRITSSQFHITVVCPPLQTDEQEPQKKSNFVAVVQYEVSMLLTPPQWPFVVRVPIPRCLNNKLHFVLEEDEQSTSSSKVDKLIVEFDPPLVHRPQPRARKSDDASMGTNVNGDQTPTTDDEIDSDVAIVGPFAATDSLVVRWADVDAGKDTDLLATGGRESIRAREIESKMIIEKFEQMDDTETARITVKTEVTLRGASYPALDKTAVLQLAFSPSCGVRWIPKTLNVRCDRPRILQSWSTKEDESSILSRSSSVNTFAPLASYPHVDKLPSGESLNHVEVVADDEDNLVNVQPPKGVADISMSFDGSVDSASNTETPGLFVAQPIERTRKVSGTSLKSIASIYSQQSLHAPPFDSLQLFLRPAAIREAHMDGAGDLVFNISGVIEVPSASETDATESTALVPTLLAQGLITKTVVILDDKRLSLLNEDGEEYSNTKEGVLHEAGVYIKAALIGEDEDVTGDISAATALPSRGGRAHEEGCSSPRLRADESTDVLTIAAISPLINSDQEARRVEDRSGIVDQADLTVWISDVESYTRASRKAVYKIRMSWPHTLPQSDQTSSQLSSVVFALPLPRKHVHEDIDILHASVDGVPVVAYVRTPPVKREKEASPMLVEVVLPKQAGASPAGSMTLLYAVKLEAEGAASCLFAPIASTIAHLHIKMYDDKVQDSVAIIRYTHEPSSSVLRHDRDNSSATLDTTMLPSMTSIFLDYAPRTKPLVPLLGQSPAPVSRRLTGTYTPLRNDLHLPPVHEPPSPSSASSRPLLFGALDVPPTLQSQSQATKEIVSPPLRRIPIFLSVAGLILTVVLSVVLTDVYTTIRTMMNTLDSHDREWQQTSTGLMVRQETSLATIQARPLHFLAWLSTSLINFVKLPFRILLG